MHRIANQKHSESISAAMDLLPERLRIILEPVHVLTGVDPVFAGLHKYRDASYGRSYANTAHVAYSFHQLHLPKDRRATTMVLPRVASIRTIIHELGHVLDAHLNFDHDPVLPLDWYAKTNQHEAFAQSFAAWVLPFGHGYGKMKDILYRKDRKTVELFERLVG